MLFQAASITEAAMSHAISGNQTRWPNQGADLISQTRFASLVVMWGCGLWAAKLHIKISSGPSAQELSRCSKYKRTGLGTGKVNRTGSGDATRNTEGIEPEWLNIQAWNLPIHQKFKKITFCFRLTQPTSTTTFLRHFCNKTIFQGLLKLERSREESIYAKRSLENAPLTILSTGGQ